MAWFRCTGNTGGSLKLRTASGAIASFETNLAAVLQSLKCEINASGGNGTPDSPIPIVGHSELNLVRCGKNLLDVTLTSRTVNDVVFTVNSDKTITANGTADGNIYLQIGTIHVVAGQTYTLTGCPSGGGSGVYSLYASLTDGNKNDYGSGNTFTATVTEDVPVRIAVYNTKTINGTCKPQIELGSQATAYAPYNGTPYLVQFGQTVYGGEYTADGKLRVTYESVMVDGSYFDGYNADGWARGVFSGAEQDNAKTKTSMYPVGGSSGDRFTWLVQGYFRIYDSSFTSLEDVQAKFNANPMQLVYALATPIEIDVSALSVDTLIGVNNVFHDGNGDTEVKYLYKA